MAHRNHRGSGLARLHYLLGRLFAFFGWQFGAVRAYHDALSCESTFVEAHFHLGEAYAAKGLWYQARGAFGEALHLRPSDVETLGNLVVTLGRVGLWCEAVDGLRRLIRLRPDAAELQLLLGGLLNRLGRPHEALRALRSASLLPPIAPSGRFFLGEALLGPTAWASILASHGCALATGPYPALRPRDSQGRRRPRFWRLGLATRNLTGMLRKTWTVMGGRLASSGSGVLGRAHVLRGRLLASAGQPAPAIRALRRGLEAQSPSMDPFIHSRDIHAPRSNR